MSNSKHTAASNSKRKHTAAHNKFYEELRSLLTKTLDEGELNQSCLAEELGSFVAHIALDSAKTYQQYIEWCECKYHKTRKHKID